MGSQIFGRRDFLKVAGLGSAALLFGNRLNAIGLRFPNRGVTDLFVPDTEISLTATDKRMQILPGAQTRVYRYEGQLVSGSGATVQAVPDSYLGPILRVKRGTKLRILFHNNLIENSVIHPHGLQVPEECDGHPMQAIGPGQTKVYEFEMIDRAGPYWFHPHPHMRTSEQVMMGLAGLMYVWDPEEEMAIPGASTGANDIPIIIQDRSFDQNNQISYQPNMMWGFLGDRILVNGKPNAAFSLEPRAYRLRILNGSNARTYKLAWSNNMPLAVIGVDGGLLPAVVSRNYVMVMPGERVDIWADFSSLAGKQVILQSLAFQAGGMGMMGGGMRGMGGIANGTAFDVLTVNVSQKATIKPVLGPLPALSVRYDANNVPDYNTPRPFVISMGRMMTWTINGRVFEMEAVAEDEKVLRDEVTTWEWVNNSPIPHPMHIHNVHFQVLQRVAPSFVDGYNTINQGLIDGGWKDTVSVWPGERVKVAMKFGPHTGMYMYHCHILEHEDMTMMRNLMVMDPTMPGM
ncbi:MAG: twin-arginine translocation signal domain-containing protein [Chloroflexi bacterium]|nr:MAG: twin-arginine translocation signal domain-containing protein [Chloroflexota bacterium]